MPPLQLVHSAPTPACARSRGSDRQRNRLTLVAGTGTLHRARRMGALPFRWMAAGAALFALATGVLLQIAFDEHAAAAENRPARAMISPVPAEGRAGADYFYIRLIGPDVRPEKE